MNMHHSSGLAALGSSCSQLLIKQGAHGSRASRRRDRVAETMRHAQKSDPAFHKVASQLLLSNDSLPGLIPPFDRLRGMFDDKAKLGEINMHIHGWVRSCGKEPLPDDPKSKTRSFGGWGGGKL